MISSSLPEAERQRIVHGLQGIETDACGEELAERVRQYLRDAGYFNARAEDMQVSGITETQSGRSADFSVRVEPGLVTRWATLHFKMQRPFLLTNSGVNFP